MAGKKKGGRHPLENADKCSYNSPQLVRTAVFYFSRHLMKSNSAWWLRSSA